MEELHDAIVKRERERNIVQKHGQVWPCWLISFEVGSGELAVDEHIVQGGEDADRVSDRVAVATFLMEVRGNNCEGSVIETMLPEVGGEVDHEVAIPVSLDDRTITAGVGQVIRMVAELEDDTGVGIGVAIVDIPHKAIGGLWSWSY